MTAIQIFSICLLILAFVVSNYRRVNVGLVTMAAAGLLCVIGHVPIKKFYTDFPGSLVIVLVGVSFLFWHVNNSGAIDRLVDGAMKIVGHRTWLLPWVMFLLGAVISAMSASVAAAAIVMPLAMRTAVRYRISFLLMALVMIFGAQAGGYSPISVWGLVVDNAVTKAKFDLAGGSLFGVEFFLNLACAIVAFLLCGGIRLIRRKDELPSGGTGPQSGAADRGGEPVGGSLVPHGPVASGISGSGKAVAVAVEPAQDVERKRLGAYGIASIVVTLMYVAALLIFGADVGLAAVAAGVVLQIIFRRDESAAIQSLPWAVILMITGVVMYLAVLEEIGTLDAISKHLQGIGSVSLAVLAVCYISSIFSSVESSGIVVLGVVMPILLSVLPSDLTSTQLLMAVNAVGWSVAVTGTSPFHVNGALALANSPKDEQGSLFKKLLSWELALAAVVPLLGWGVALAAGGF